MSDRARRLLVGYLIVVGCCLVYLLVSIAAVDLPETAVLPEGSILTPRAAATATGPAGPAATPTGPTGPVSRATAGPTGPAPRTTAPTGAQEASPVQASDGPLLTAVFPYVTGDGGASTVSLMLYGRNFAAGDTVRINMRDRTPDFIAPTLIRTVLRSSDLVGSGLLSVDVVGGGGKTSNAVAVPLARPRGDLAAFGLHWAINREMQLILLVVFAGALGSYVHAVKSLADFIGNRTLTASWFWWYVTRPFLGMAMAMIFYAVLRGGFLAGTAAGANVVNPFGVMAIAAMVGMFSDKAAQKLGEIFDTLFKSVDQRGGKLIAPVIDKLEPDTVAVGGTQPIKLTIKGERLGSASSVRLNAEERKPDTVSEKQLEVTLRSEDLKTARSIKVTVVNPDGAVSPAVTLHVSDLEITTAQLNAATVNQDYSMALAASRGGGSYTWAMSGNPAWLKLAANTLTGKPTSPGTHKIVVKVTDDSGASVAKEMTLTVNPQPAPSGG